MGRKSEPTAKLFALINLLWLGVLVFAMADYWGGWLFFDKLDAENPVGGLVPLFVPWAGALGGVTISMVGTAKFSRSWEHRWNIWHALRPVLGAISGTVAFIVIVVVLRTAGGLSDATKVLPDDFLARGTFFVIAYVAGFRDRLFLELIAKIAKVLFSNGDNDDEPARQLLVNVDQLNFGPVVLNTPTILTLRAILASKEIADGLPDTWVSVEGKDKAQFNAAPPAPVEGQLDREISVTYLATQQGKHKAILVLTVGDAKKRIELKGEAT